MNLREILEKELDRILRYGLFFALFLMPFKFGVPYLEQETFLFPSTIPEWIFLPYWPLEFFNGIPLVLFLLWGLKSFLGGRWVLRWNSGLSIGFAFLAVVLISSLLSVYPYVSKLISQQIASYFLLFFLSSQIFSAKNRDIEKAAAFFTAAATLLSLFALYQHFFGLAETLEWIQKGGIEEKLPPNVLSRLQGKRAFATFIYPNSLGGFLLLAFPIALAFGANLVRTQKMKALTFFGALIAAALAFLFLLRMENFATLFGAVAGSVLFPLSILSALAVTFSKGAILSFFLLASAFAAWFFFLKKKEPLATSRILIGSWIFASAAILILCLFGYFYRDFWLHRIQMGTFQNRIGYWDAALRILSCFPLLGSGPGTFGALYPSFKNFGAEKTQLAHNDYLQLSSEIGILGGLLFCLCIAWILWKGFQSLKASPTISWIWAGIFWGLLGLYLHHGSDFDFYVPALGGCEFIFLGALSSAVLPQREFKAVLSAFAVRVLFFVGIVFSVFAVSESLVTQLQAKIAFDLARRYAKTSDLVAAKKFAHRACEKEKGNAFMKVFEGKLRAKTGEPDQALKLYNEAASLHPYWAAPYQLKAEIFLDDWKKTQSPDSQKGLIEAWRGALERHPSGNLTRLQLARFLENLGMLEEALIEYKAILKWDPANSVAQEKARELGRRLAERLKDMAVIMKAVRAKG